MEPLRIAAQWIGFWLCAAVVVPLNAQQSTWSVEISSGFALPHRSEMLALVTGHSRGLALRHGNWKKDGWRQNWSQHGSVWQGVQMSLLDGGSHELGMMSSAMWMVALPIHSRFHVELGSGLAWSTAPYDPIERPLSIAIGTRLNAGIHIGTTVQVFQFEAGWVAVGAGLTHFSNGALALPNLGLNNLHLRVQAGWKTKRCFPERVADEPANGIKRWQWAFAGRVGARDINLPGGTLHPTVSTGIYAQKRTNAATSWVLALDIAHNQSLQQFSETPLSTADRLQLGSLTGINLHFGRGHLMLLQGWIWTHPDQALGRRHLQAVFAYDISQRWAIEMGLRSFRLRADYPFIGIRFRPSVPC